MALGGKEDTLRRRYRNWESYDIEHKMRDEPSDDVSEWIGVEVFEGRVRALHWYLSRIGAPLMGAIPAEIGALDGLLELVLDANKIRGHLPREVGRLTSLTEFRCGANCLEGPLPAELGALTALTQLWVHENSFTGEIPSTLANLTNLDHLSLSDNKFDTIAPPHVLIDKNVVQEYLATLRKVRSSSW